MISQLLLINRLRKFTTERNWERYHTPKNLIMALSVEVAELMELFQWVSEKEESDNVEVNKRQQIMSELGDIMLYLIRLTDILCIDLIECAWNKMDQNELKYPVALSKGKFIKYNERK